MTSKLKKFVDCLLGKDNYCNQEGLPSVSLALKNILGEKNFNRIILSTPDRRQIMEEAAKLKGVSEDELIKQVAEKLNLPVFFKPKPIKLDLLPAFMTVKDLRRSGVYPIFNQDQVCGVVCVDPAELSLVKQLYTGNNIYLTSWSAVLAAIEESEQNYLYGKIKAEKTADFINQQLVAKLLENILHQMQIKSSENLEFDDTDGITTYSFEDNSQQLWQGDIEKEAGLQLMKYLQHRVAANKTDLSFFGFGELKLAAENGRICIRRHKESNIVMFPGTFANSITKEQNLEFKDHTVLLIDDNSSYRELMLKYLSKQGFRAKAVSGINPARALLKAKQIPSLIVCDLNLEDGSAFNLLQELKNSAEFMNIQFIVLTSDQQQENELQALGSGADAFIAKNKDPRILALHIKRLLKYRAAA